MAKKSTKKFQKNHLKRTIEQRKVVQAYNKKIVKGNKKRVRYEDNSETAQQPRIVNKKDPVLGDTSAKELFSSAGGAANVDEAFPKKKGGKKRKQADETEGSPDDVADFTQFLDQEDQEMLNANNSGDDSDQDDDEDIDDEDILGGSDSEDERSLKKAKAVGNEKEELTRKHVAKWKKALIEDKSLRALKRAAVAFRSAVHVGNDPSETANFKYSITDPEVYNDVITLVLAEFPEVLNYHIPISTNASGRRTVTTNTKKYHQLAPLLKSLSNNILKLLSDLNDSKTVSAVLTASDKLLPYFASFRKFIKEFIKAVVDVWSTSPDESSRLAAWIVIRSTAESGDKGMLELCMKTSYAGMVKNCRHTSVHTLPLINFMKNTAATLYSLDAEVSYQTAFDYIRQLAIHLRNSVVQKTKDSYKTVYNWQYIHSLDFWRRVLSFHCDVEKEQAAGSESPLRPLIYPLVQVTLGTMRLIPAAQYFPLRFNLFRSLVDLSRDVDVYIPLLPVITELLTSTTVTKFAKPSTLRPFDFEHNIRANTAYLGTRVYQNGVCEQIVDCIIEFYGLYSKNIAFPELIVPCVITLKRYARRKDRLQTVDIPQKKGKKGKKVSKNENYKFHKQLLEVVEKLEVNSKFIQEKRKNVEFAPGSQAMVNAFLADLSWEKTPLGQYLKVQREIREEKLRVLRESLKNEDQKTKEDIEDDRIDDENDDSEEEFDLGDDSEQEGAHVEDDEDSDSDSE
ncbi:Noc2p family-domain-containing protein [Lipomyces japonicus]|uniref:Noc2p family-domain-containing protein n=1 Tax=Lipomyces japonicus TaxID=56871 RepID=UPI0034CE3E5A